MRSVMEGRVKMRQVKVKTKELLTKVKANREKHITDYEQALKDYKDLAKEKIESAFNKAMKDLKHAHEFNLQRISEMTDKEIEAGPGDSVHLLSAVSFNLKVPQNHSKDYDAVISMLEMCVDEEIQIMTDEHAMYVMDDWDWKTDFRKLSSEYSTSSKMLKSR
jgi:DNA integrity scanning protein DisA with diadenylate cyclase activity